MDESVITQMTGMGGAEFRNSQLPSIRKQPLPINELRASPQRHLSN